MYYIYIAYSNQKIKIDKVTIFFIVIVLIDFFNLKKRRLQIMDIQKNFSLEKIFSNLIFDVTPEQICDNCNFPAIGAYKDFFYCSECENYIKNN